MISCFFIRHGSEGHLSDTGSPPRMSGNEALELVRLLRPGSVETAQQVLIGNLTHDRHFFFMFSCETCKHFETLQYGCPNDIDTSNLYSICLLFSVMLSHIFSGRVYSTIRQNVMERIHRSQTIDWCVFWWSSYVVDEGKFRFNYK